MPYKDFGKRVKRHRKLAQLTQEKLAEKAGISIAFVGHIERGTRKCSVDTLIKLSKALKVSPNVLLQDSLDDDMIDVSVGVSERHKRLLREISERIIEYNADIDDEEDDG